MADEEDMRDINIAGDSISEEQQTGTQQALADGDGEGQDGNDEDES